MPLTNVAKYNLKQIIYSIISFVIASVIIITISSPEDFPLLRSVLAAVFISLAVSFYEFYITKKIRNYIKPPLLLFISVLYYIGIFFFLLVSFIYIHLIFKQNLPLKEAFAKNVVELIPQGIQNMMFFLFMYLTIRFLVDQLKARTLKGIAKKFFWGKPGIPIMDTKIFMFMDLVSSTTYAEKLGYFKYSKFIRDIYKEIDEFVLATDGIIYQYVGDEVVIVWSLEDGLKNNNCLKFIHLFRERINELANYFMTQYDIIPEFKAAFHYGEVAISEIGGVLRRDIAFHGDTVNTTARICSKCRDLNEKILISGELAEQLSTDDKIEFESIGKFILKGKKFETELFRIKENLLSQTTFTMAI